MSAHFAGISEIKVGWLKKFINKFINFTILMHRKHKLIGCNPSDSDSSNENDKSYYL